MQGRRWYGVALLAIFVFVITMSYWNAQTGLDVQAGVKTDPQPNKQIPDVSLEQRTINKKVEEILTNLAEIMSRLQKVIGRLGGKEFNDNHTIINPFKEAEASAANGADTTNGTNTLRPNEDASPVKANEDISPVKANEDVSAVKANEDESPAQKAVTHRKTHANSTINILLAPEGTRGGLARRWFALDSHRTLWCNETRVVSQWSAPKVDPQLLKAATLVYIDAVHIKKNVKILREALCELKISKPLNQTWIAFSTETSVYYDHLYPLSKLRLYPEIDIVSTNRLDSDIPVIEMGSIYDVNVDTLLRPTKMPWQKRIPKVVVAYSNCGTPSGRESYIRPFLSQFPHLVNNIGNCWSGQGAADGKTNTPPHSLEGVHEKLKTLEKYMFTFCMENSYVQDYVSEKVYHALQVGTIPIYKGAPNAAKDFLPCTDCVIWADDYPDVASLAAHLQYVANNETAFNKYLKWKENPRSDVIRRLRKYSLDTALCRWVEASAKPQNRHEIPLLC